MPLYPLKFRPRFVEKIWGGRKFQTILGKSLPNQQIGESWELFDFPPGVVDNSTDWISAPIANGPLAGQTLHQAVQQFGADLHGDVPLIQPHGQFPILIKYLDARESLSVQVHPDQAYCEKHPGSYLKNEAWYIVQSDPGAEIHKGVRVGITRERLQQAIADGTVPRLMDPIPVMSGECYYLPSGTLHGLGAGILVAEVQTPSDTTFRVFDFSRVDPSTGKPRSLHVQEALECIALHGTRSRPQPRSHVASFFTTVTRLVSCDHFKIEKVRFSEGVEEVIPYDEPVVWMMLSGKAQIRVADLADPVDLTVGDTVLLPAVMNKPTLKTLSDCVWLEITFPTKPEVG